MTGSLSPPVPLLERAPLAVESRPSSKLALRCDGIHRWHPPAAPKPINTGLRAENLARIGPRGERRSAAAKARSGGGSGRRRRRGAGALAKLQGGAAEAGSGGTKLALWAKLQLKDEIGRKTRIGKSSCYAFRHTSSSAISAQTTRSGRLSAGETGEASGALEPRGRRRREAGGQPVCKRGAPQALHSRLRQNLKKRLLGHPCVLLGDISILIPSLLWRGPPHLPVLPCIACLVREGLIEASI